MFVLDRSYDQRAEFDFLSDNSENNSLFYELELGNIWNTVTCRRMATGPTFRNFLITFPKDMNTFDLIIHDSAYCELFLGLVDRLDIHHMSQSQHMVAHSIIAVSYTHLDVYKRQT